MERNLKERLMPNKVIIVGSDINVPVSSQPAEVTTIRMVAAGQVAPGAHKLCWISCNPSAGLSLWELTDAIAGGGVVLLDCYSTARETKLGVLSPPMPFATGIWLETLTNVTGITFGYI